MQKICLATAAPENGDKQNLGQKVLALWMFYKGFT
jgi:hypothetical protein